MLKKITLGQHFWLFAGLAVLLAITYDLFYIDSYINTPQFDHIDSRESFRYVYDQITGIKRFYYLAAFMVDFVWAPILLTLGRHTIRSFFGETSSVWLYKAVAIVALLLDFWENLQYMGALPYFHLGVVQGVKMIFYGVVFVIFSFYGFKYLHQHRRLTNTFWRDMRLFVRTSWISILIIVIVILLLTQLDQGSTIIADLMERPVNVFFIYGILFFIAVALSHYPAYIEARITDRSKVTWCISSLFIPASWLGLGIVHYKTDPEDHPFNPRVTIFRHCTGLAMISAFLYVLWYVGGRFYAWFPLSGTSALLVLALAIYGYVKARAFYLKEGDDNRIAKLYRLVAILTGALIILSTVSSAVFHWSWVTLVLMSAATIMLMVLYIFFRLQRKKNTFSNNASFVRKLAIAGWISLLPLAIANLHPPFAVHQLSPLLILLLYLVNFYGAAVILIKHVQFYRDEEICDGAEDIRRKFRFYPYLSFTLLVAILGFIIAASSLKSDLHLLRGYDEGRVLTYDQFRDSIPQTTHQGDTLNGYLQVASYGGGLKANLWTLLVLNKLQESTDDDFVRATISMSGTSGGMLGIGNYGVLWANHRKPETLWSKIYDIGKFNHLAIDFTYLLGKDLVRELIPTTLYHGTDRSYVAMQFYEELTGLGLLISEPEEHAYRTTWHSMFERSGYYPAVIVNSWSTSGAQGNAFSLRMQERDFRKAFPGAINMMDAPACNGSIDYYGALSASNRFPVFSPAARIKGKGHFLDGGYFDNSGLSSSTAFNRFAFSDNTCNGKKIRYLIIDTHKKAYILYALERYLAKKPADHCIDEDETGELSAIVAGLTSLDKVPNYFEGTLDSAFHIFLPLPFTYEDILHTFDGRLLIEPDSLRAFMHRENTRVREALQAYPEYRYDLWGVVEPPLARLNSEAGVRYQEAMIHHHPHIRDQLMAINRWIKGDAE